MRRFVALSVALLLVAGLVFTTRHAPSRSVAALCTPKPTAFQYGTMFASRAGSVVPALQRPLPTGKITEIAKGAWWTIGYWLGVFAEAAKGHPAPDPVIAPVDCSQVLAACSANPPQGGGDDPSKLAALGGGNPAVATVAGPDPAIVQGVIRIGREKGIPERGWVVALAAGLVESGVRNLNYGDRDSLGWLQQRAGWGTASQRMDPTYATTKFYEALTRVSGWESMSIGEAAQAVQISGYPDRYAQRQAEAEALVAQYAGSVGTSNPPAAATAAACPAGGGPGTIGTWNVLFRNSDRNIVAAAPFADLVGLQEIRRNEALTRIPGYGVTEGKMAVPIIWRKSALDLVWWKRETVLKGFARDKSAVYGQWRNRQTGKEFIAINTHMLVQGGAGWRRQAAAVNRIRERLALRGLPIVVLADMNAPEDKVLQFFTGKPLGGRIDYVVGFGITPTNMETLSSSGSDHARRRFTFPAIGGSAAPGVATSGSVASGEAGIREIAKRHGATYVAAHRDPQGLPAFDIGSSGAKNSAIAEDMRTNHEALGLRYVISQMRIASDREGWAWRPYTPITSAGDFRHEGHVHVSW